MKGFKNKKEFEQWAYDQFDRYGIRQPDTYTEQELIDLNPAVPTDFIKQHVKNRNKVSK
jgi:aspartyl-tRNA synthetase